MEDLCADGQVDDVVDDENYNIEGRDDDLEDATTDGQVNDVVDDENYIIEGGEEQYLCEEDLEEEALEVDLTEDGEVCEEDGYEVALEEEARDEDLATDDVCEEDGEVNDAEGVNDNASSRSCFVDPGGIGSTTERYIEVGRWVVRSRWH